MILESSEKQKYKVNMFYGIFWSLNAVQIYGLAFSIALLQWEMVPFLKHVIQQVF